MVANVWTGATRKVSKGWCKRDGGVCKQGQSLEKVSHRLTVSGESDGQDLRDGRGEESGVYGKEVRAQVEVA